MRALVIGGGGREHALAWALLQSGQVSELLASPGNPGIAAIDRARCVAAEGTDRIAALTGLAEREAIDLTVVGPEDPLVMGITDAFATRGLRIFGPTAAAARIEGSKAFAKELMAEQGVPTAAARSFSGPEGATDAKTFLGTLPGPWVVKADGLAAGKGVRVTDDLGDAEAWVDACLSGRQFGDAGDSVLIEEYLDGPELSLLCITDGHDILPLAPARDHKRLGDHDTGPNTGGMGAYSPVPQITDDLVERVIDTIVEPVVTGLGARGTPFSGLLYTGLVLTNDGPKVLEFNVRFGDPEAQAVLPRLGTGLDELILACTEGRLGQTRVEWRNEVCVTVVAAAEGYPDAPRRGDAISGLNAVDPDVMVFHAGTSADPDSSEIVTAGGRVLAVSALGASLGNARVRAYDSLGKINFDGMQFRTDIGENVS